MAVCTVKENGYYVAKDGISRYLPAGVTRHTSDYGWTAVTSSKYGRYNLYFGDTAHGGIEAAYQKALRAAGAFSVPGEVAPAADYRLIAKLEALDNASTDYNDRFDLPTGICYWMSTNKRLYARATLGPRNITRSCKYGDTISWSKMIQELLDARKEYLVDRAMEQYADVMERIA